MASLLTCQNLSVWLSERHLETLQPYLRTNIAFFQLTQALDLTLSLVHCHQLLFEKLPIKSVNTLYFLSIAISKALLIACIFLFMNSGNQRDDLLQVCSPG